MYYFVSENAFNLNSGTEHAQARRVNLFNAHGQHAFYVTRNYNRHLTRNLEQLGLTQAAGLNMYDYFQGVQNVERDVRNLRLLPQFPLERYKIKAQGPNYSLVTDGGRLVARVDVMPGTVQLPDVITYYDGAQNITARDLYDWRGFKSATEYYHPDGQLGVQKLLNIKGEVVLEITHMYINGQVAPTMWRLVNYHGRNWRFNTEDQLLRFFMNEVIASDVDAEKVVIADRRTLDPVLNDLQGTTRKFAYLHGIQSPNPRRLTKGPLYDVYKPLLTGALANLTILVATDAQRQDLLTRNPQLKVAVAPDTDVTVAEDVQPVPPAHQITVVGRIAKDKRPEEAIMAMTKVIAVVPDAKLRFYGFAESTEYLAELQELVKKHELGGHVAFMNYVTGADYEQALNETRVLLQTSKAESFGMTALDALAHGVPVVAYDVPYQPNAALVGNASAGYLVTDGARKELTDRIIKLLTDDDDWQKKRQNARTYAKLYGGEATYQQWCAVLKKNVK